MGWATFWAKFSKAHLGRMLCFSKNSPKKLAFLNQNKAKLCKMLIITLVFEKNANFFAEYCQKSQKIVIITSTPGLQLQAHMYVCTQ
jgi:hypothetical protein